MHHSHQSYQSDIWPVGVILLQFVVRKYNIFNNVRMINKPNNVKNCYYINYIVELANFFGCQEVIDQCKNLGYELKLPKDIEEFKFRNIACMYSSPDPAKATTTSSTTSSTNYSHSTPTNALQSKTR